MLANHGKRYTSYLSKTICEEVVKKILGKAAEDIIVSELKQAKYFSISLDSTPDIGHTDQLCFTVRYVKPTGPLERFLAFLPMEGHTAQQIFDTLVQYTSEKGINLADCRGQSYDNASNMTWKYNGVQEFVKEKFGDVAEYVPCFAHSLNLVGVCAAQSCPEIVRFFDFFENIYVFFAAVFFKLFSSRPIFHGQIFSRPLKKGLHLESISDSAIFPPKSRCSLKKKKKMVFASN